MKSWHVILLVLAAYFVGAYYGTFATTAVAKVQSLV